MSETTQFPSEKATPWHELADRVLSGYAAIADEALAILQADDEQLPDLLAAAFRIRRRFFGNAVRLYFLINAKSGLCAEDCGYCSQSRRSSADIAKYDMVTPETLLAGAEQAMANRARTYCMVISGAAPTERDMTVVESVVPEIKRKHKLKVCASVGLITAEQATRLKTCGVDRVNHNVNTSAQFYGEICTTHTYQQRIETIRSAREAGLEICSGGIVGMGERDRDVVQMALELRELGVDSIPVNFLLPIEGTPLAGADHLNPRYCLKVLCMARFVNPRCEIRIAAGREKHLGSLQPLGLYAANSIFVGDYLTTKGQAPEADYRMIEELGFTVEGDSP